MFKELRFDLDEYPASKSLIWKILPRVKSNDPKDSKYKLPSLIYSSFKKVKLPKSTWFKKAEAFTLSSVVTHVLPGLLCLHNQPLKCTGIHLL
jgi:hypothetical protein